jgi:acetylornithine/N-succinyldiaminopimelate aminotransferase
MELETLAEHGSHAHLLLNYARAPVTFVRGEGVELIDEHGTRYLDFVAGIAVAALGHAHPEIARAIADQAKTLVHCSNLYMHEPAGKLANKLAEISGFDRVFFCNSGAEANEAAIKLARKHAHRAGHPGQKTIVYCTDSFHGRTLGALAATDSAKYKEGFDPLPEGFRITPFNDIGALENAIDENAAAFIVEPVQGETGVNIADREFLQAARSFCDKHGALLIYDEIQCGIGRLGTNFAFQTFGVTPDAFTLAKSLANGLPIGALVMRGECANTLRPGDHGSTFGGSPVPCAAALRHLELREELDLNTHVHRVGARFMSELKSLSEDYPEFFGPPRGLGLMLGLPVKEPEQAQAFVDLARDRHLLINAAGHNTLRFIPPLIVSEENIADGFSRLRKSVAQIGP